MLWRWWWLDFGHVLLEPFLVVEFDIFSMFASGAMCFSHRG